MKPSSTSRKYTESSGGKSLSIISVESNRLALPKLLFTSPGALSKGEYHFAHCGAEESRLSIGRGIQTLKDKYEELLTWKDKQPLPINVAVSSAIHGLGGAFAGILVHSMFQSCLGSQSASLLGGGPWVQARNFGAILAVRSGIWTTMINIPGIPDIVSSIAAGSGAGVTHSLLLGEPTYTVLATFLGFAAWTFLLPLRERALMFSAAT